MIGKPVLTDLETQVQSTEAWRVTITYPSHGDVSRQRRFRISVVSQLLCRVFLSYICVIYASDPSHT